VTKRALPPGRLRDASDRRNDRRGTRRGTRRGHPAQSAPLPFSVPWNGRVGAPPGVETVLVATAGGPRTATPSVGVCSAASSIWDRRARLVSRRDTTTTGVKVNKVAFTKAQTHARSNCCMRMQSVHTAGLRASHAAFGYEPGKNTPSPA